MDIKVLYSIIRSGTIDENVQVYKWTRRMVQPKTTLLDVIYDIYLYLYCYTFNGNVVLIMIALANIFADAAKMATIYSAQTDN